jgi:hypothetical protein
VDLSKNNVLDPFHTTNILSFEIKARQLILPPKQPDGAAYKISNQITCLLFTASALTSENSKV